MGRAFLARPNNTGAGWSMLGLVKNSTQPTGYRLPAFAGICIEICNGGRALVGGRNEADDPGFFLHLLDDLADLISRQARLGKTNAVETAA